jgi:hypothetical protein
MVVITRFKHSRHRKNGSHFNDDHDMPASLKKKILPRHSVHQTGLENLVVQQLIKKYSTFYGT